MAAIDDNLQAVAARIRHAARAVARDPSCVRLLAVTKTVPLPAIEEAFAAGLRSFGENYVQEALDKKRALEARIAAQDISHESTPPVEWHLIGPLQSNKARAAAECFDWVHTIDREKVARRLSEARPVAAPPLNVLIQVNVSGESTKSGVAPHEAASLARAVSQLPRLRLRGLMAIPEPTDDAGLQAGRFASMRSLFDALNDQGFELDTLSMGMSQDLEAAVSEGSTLVRVGTALFGARPPKAAHKAAA
jgi:PLP dependent protein